MSYRSRGFVALCAAFMLLFAANVFAQAVAPVAYNLRTRFQGSPSTGTPIAGPTTVSKTLLSCGSAKPTPASGTVVNPTQWYVDDPGDSTKACINNNDAGGALAAVPISTMPMVMTASALSATGVESAESAVSNPFTKPGGAPPVPTGMKLARVLLAPFSLGQAMASRRSTRALSLRGALFLAGDPLQSRVHG